MKNHLSICAGVVIAICLAGISILGQTNSAVISPRAVLSMMQRVADWQLAHLSKHTPADWTQGVSDAGFMALAGISGDSKYRHTMLAMGETNHWRLGPRLHDQAVGQAYCELYLLYREPKMIAPMRERFDDILAHPSNMPNSNRSLPKNNSQELWSSSDSIFMAAPAWVLLSAATGDERYMDFAVTNWWRTSEHLYDMNEHLFFRDRFDLNQREANRQKMFLDRDNGLGMAGLVRILEYLPMNNPDRPRFEQQFKEMAAKILTCQQPNGLWHARLLTPDSNPLKDLCSSGFCTYALAWGVNLGLLDRTTFEPSVRKAWSALVACVGQDGKLAHVGPMGANANKLDSQSTDVCGVGAFLLAGSEIYKMAVLENTQPIAVRVTNPANFWRESETVETKGLISKWNGSRTTNKKFAVMDGAASRILTSQAYSETPNTRPNKLLFQVDLAPGETRTFYILDAAALAAVPPPIVKTFARYVPERYDDFAWESDRIAFRAYGQALIKAEGTESSGMDVWIKKNRGLIVNTMYATKRYHEDNGQFMDDYRVGSSRGCGGLGVWDGRKLQVSSNWKSYKIITTGPIRSEFELTYDAWDAGNGRKVSEVKRLSIDAGSWMTKEQTTLRSEDNSLLTIGVGLAERACPTNRVEYIARNRAEGWMTYWQPEDKPKGVMAVAVILSAGSVEELTNDDPGMPSSKKHANVPQPTHEGYPPIRNQLAIVQVEPGKPFTYYFGASWDRSGDFTNHVQWEAYVKRFAARRDQPLHVTIGN